VTHAELQAALARMDITVDAAEAHGWLCGALCTRGGYGAKEWLAELAAERATADPERVPEPEPELLRLPAWTRELLDSPAFEFEPLLPGEGEPLADRVAALAAWCEGFLFGFGSGAPDAKVAQGGEVAEYLGDLADIARAELEPGRDTEAGEGDYAELFEFVRAGAQLAFDELAGARAHAAG
jgi:uncharacterized protein YgfB (UPF0149 family)